MSHDPKSDEAAFGVIYGSITAMGVLAAAAPYAQGAIVMAAMVFVSILAVALTKLYADVVARVLRTREAVSLAMIAQSWPHSRDVLIAANAPTLILVLTGLGVFNQGLGVQLAQLSILSVLVFYGARIGWRLTGRIIPTLIGAGITSAIGVSLSVLKNLIH